MYNKTLADLIHFQNYSTTRCLKKCIREKYHRIEEEHKQKMCMSAILKKLS